MKISAHTLNTPLWVSILLLTASRQLSPASIIYSENFDSVALGANKEEGIATGSGGPQTAVWSGTAPTGWEIDDSGMQGLDSPDTDGVVEWAGWSFTDQRWWAFTAGQQGREGFLKGGGSIAVTDPDEWDDLARKGTYNSYLISPAIPLAGAAGVSEVTLRFDSSWLPESPQKALILVSWDSGAYTEVLRWTAEEGPTFHPGATNETVYLPLTVPSGAQNLRLKFGTIDAGNNWFWAVDNLVLYTGGEPPHFETHPVSPETNVGSSAVLGTGAAVDFFITTSETPAVSSLQWVRMNGATRTVLTGQTGDSLSLANLAGADSGDYLCEATNADGTVKSAPIHLTVAGYTITAQPEPVTVVSGFPASLTAAAESSFPLTYQWYKGPEATRVPIEGATSATLDFAAVSMADDGLYSLKITASAVSLSGFSSTVRLQVLPVSIDAPPSSVEVPAGEDAGFEVTAVGPPGSPLTYQWYFRPFGGTTETAIDGATASTLAVNDVTRFGTGYYSVKVTSPLGSATSAAAKLTVTVEPASVEIFKENWQSVVLGPNVEEGITTGAGSPNQMTTVWSPTAPNGWVIDNTGMPVPNPADVAGTDGVKEWYGWNFAEPSWWATTAEGQGRAGFSKGLGDSLETGIPAVIAVADADEWDDLTHSPGTYNSSLTSPAIPLTGTQPGSVVLTFDSSWQREAPMKAKVEISLDGGAFQSVLLWANEGPDQHDNNVDETVSMPVSTAAGNTSMKVRFTLFDAGNNWWWAVDNISVTAVATTVPTAPPVITSLKFDAATKLVTVKWSSVSGRAYKLQHSQNLQDWLPAVTGLSGAAGAAETEVSVDVDTLFPAAAPGKLFFRISE